MDRLEETVSNHGARARNPAALVAESWCGSLPLLIKNIFLVCSSPASSSRGRLSPSFFSVGRPARSGSVIDDQRPYESGGRSFGPEEALPKAPVAVAERTTVLQRTSVRYLVSWERQAVSEECEERRDPHLLLKTGKSTTQKALAPELFEPGGLLSAH